MKLGLFSVGYAGLWGQAQLDLPAFIERAGRMGFESVMLVGKRPHLSPLGLDEVQLSRLRQSLAKAKVECGAVAAYTDFAGGGAAEVPFIEMQIAYVDALARAARALGSKLVRVFTAYEPPTAGGERTAALWRTVIVAMQEICDRVRAYDVTVAVQNHHDIALHTDAMLELLYEVDRPNCKLAFDAWSPALRGEDVYEAAKKAAPHMALTTNADYVRVPRYQYRPALVNYERVGPDWVRAVPFGQGCIDYPAFFRGLADGGFDGLAQYEMCSPIRGGGSLENLDRYCGAYLAWMKEHTSRKRSER